MKWNLTSLLGAVLVLLGLAVPLATIPVVFLLQPQYRSQTRLMIPPSPKILLESEAELLQSPRILSTVVSNLSLTKSLANRFRMNQDLPPEVALALLKRQVEVKIYRNTRVLETVVQSESKTEACDIANEITKVYLASSAAKAIDPANSPELLESAQPAFRPSTPNAMASTATSMMVGLVMIVIGGGAIFVSWKKQQCGSRATPPLLPT